VREFVGWDVMSYGFYKPTPFKRASHEVTTQNRAVFSLCPTLGWAMTCLHPIRRWTWARPHPTPRWAWTLLHPVSS